MWKAIVGIGEALKALATTIADRMKQWKTVRNFKILVYADMAYNLSVLLEARSALSRNDNPYDLRRLRIKNHDREPAFSLLKEVNTVRLICDRLGDLRDVSHFDIDKFPQQMEETLAYFDSRIINRELNKQRLLKRANTETKQHIESLFYKH